MIDGIGKIERFVKSGYRRIVNGLEGKKELYSEYLEVSDVRELLSGLDGSTQIDIRYSSAFDSGARHRGTSPLDANRFLAREFESSSDVGVEHIVYAGKHGERHYVDIGIGRIDTIIGERKFIDCPMKEATLDYVV